MKIAVIYKSKYGTTKSYAQWIAEELKAELFEKKEFNSGKFKEYDCVILGGGMYAGAILGSDLIKKIHCKNLIFFTVGLADPMTTDYSTHIKKIFPDGIPENTEVFHFRGGIDYEKLSFVHKKMMSMLHNLVSKKENSSDEEKLFVSTYGSKVDFTDKNSINPLIEYVKDITNRYGQINDK
jgi:menaquinone-dependent protoporphyrinogen IX oxidase